MIRTALITKKQKNNLYSIATMCFISSGRDTQI